jgi:hypothetical protein
MAKLQCTVCGGKLIVRADGKSSQCEHCDAVYTHEAMQQMLGKVEVVGEVKVAGISDADRLFQNGETFLKREESYNAYRAFSEMTEKFPEDHRGWRGIILSKTGCFTFNPYLPTEREYSNAFNTAAPGERAVLEKELDAHKKSWHAKIEKLADGTLPKEKNQDVIFYTKPSLDYVDNNWLHLLGNDIMYLINERGMARARFTRKGHIANGSTTRIRIREHGILEIDYGSFSKHAYAYQDVILIYISDDFREMKFSTTMADSDFRRSVTYIPYGANPIPDKNSSTEYNIFRWTRYNIDQFALYKTDFKQVVKEAGFFETVFGSK